MPLDPPWTHFSLSTYASSKQYLLKYTSDVLYAGLALAPFSGPDDNFNDLLCVSTSDACSYIPLDPPWTHFPLSTYASSKQYLFKSTSEVLCAGRALAPFSGPDYMSDD